ncbi:sortase domain-containing protein [Rugosimonospora africana]|uniref:Sortase n=1 Tax=Rugosimonospora africana TaxID=556532 RepID=A0A8J3R086_9ACTN|nr:sortase [Rugosimonospora africana]GIH19831.1 sortase [Rugosimonospora africana]
MTAMVAPSQVETAERAPDAASAATAPPRSTPELIAGAVSGGVCLLLLLAVGFAGYLFGLSNLSEQRAQSTQYKDFAYTLSQGTAPVGPVREGTAVAVLDVPDIGLHAVVMEGTSSRDLDNGPGHRPDTVLPGQAGVSVLYGKRVTFGAPFAHLMRLAVGDKITVTTGQGVATYVVSSFGDDNHPAPANSTNRLVLVTADSTGWPRSAVSVSADLTSTPQPNPGGRPALPANQQSMSRDTDVSPLPMLLWSQALLLLAALATVAAHRWSRWGTYVCAAPVFLAVAWNLYENLAGLLPNLY